MGRADPRRLLLGPPRRLIRHARTATLAALDGRDRARLERALPGLGSRAALERHREALRPVHQTYVAAVGTDAHAISLELAALLRLACEVLQPRTIVDLGSGLSSIVFRTYAVGADEDVTVWSVDDSPEWLERTRAFLEERGLPTDRLVSWDEVVRDPPQDADLVLHDLGNMTTRADALPIVAAMTRPGGAIVFDDVHKPPYWTSVRALVRARDIQRHRLYGATLDRHRRWSALGIMPGRS